MASALSSQSVEFDRLSIEFGPDVLRPRAWTIAQSRWAAGLMQSMPSPARVLELCAGVGHIGLAALVRGGDLRHSLVCVDANPTACAFARGNAEAAGLGDQVEVRQGFADEVVRPSERFDLVIADPPWVERERVSTFPDDPVFAIDGGDDGMEVARVCLRVADAHLVRGGSLLLQLGSVRQVELVEDHLYRQWMELRIAEVRQASGGVLIHLHKTGSG